MAPRRGKAPREGRVAGQKEGQPLLGLITHGSRVYGSPNICLRAFYFVSCFNINRKSLFSYSTYTLGLGT